MSGRSKAETLISMFELSCGLGGIGGSVIGAVAGGIIDDHRPARGVFLGFVCGCVAGTFWPLTLYAVFLENNKKNK